MNKYQKILTVVALIAFSAIIAPKANAWMGETRKQVIADAQRDSDTARIVNWDSATVIVLYRDGSDINHVFGSNGREIAFILFSAKRLSAGDVTRIQRTYGSRWEATGVVDGLATWKLRGRGLYMGTTRLEKYDKVSIFDSTKLEEVQQRTPHSAPERTTATYPPPQQPYVAPQMPTVSPARPPNDCYIIASQIYAGLKNSSYWVRAAAIVIRVKNTNEISGHTVVFSQLAPGSNIVMSDENGALELATKSHDLTEITAAATQTSLNGPSVPYVVQSGIKWIDG